MHVATIGAVTVDKKGHLRMKIMKKSILSLNDACLTISQSVSWLVGQAVSHSVSKLVEN